MTQEFLESHWAKDHELFQHGSTLEEGSGKVFKPSACAKLGTCVCKGDGKMKLAMFHKLKAVVKSAHPGTLKEPSRELKLLKDNLCVLEVSPYMHTSDTLLSEEDHAALSSLDATRPGPILYLHVGYINFLTWEMTCTRLHYWQYNPFTDFMTLVAGDEEEQVESKTLLDFLKDYCDIGINYFVRVLRIVDKRSIEYSQDMMLPKFVDVALYPDTTGMSSCFWNGSSQEFAPKISKHRKGRGSSEPGQQPSAGTRPRPRRPGLRLDKRNHDDVDVLDHNHPVENQMPEKEETHMEFDFDQILEELCAEWDVEGQAADGEESNNDNNEYMELLASAFADCQISEGDMSDSSDSGNENATDAAAAATANDKNDNDLKDNLDQDQDMDSDKGDTGVESFQTGPAAGDGAPPLFASSPRNRHPKRSSSDSAAVSVPVPVPAPKAKARPSLSLSAAGARPASMFDDATVFIGPFVIVKRYHPALSLNHWLWRLVG